MPKGPDVPSAALLMQIAADYGIDLTAAEADSYRSLMAGAINSYRRLEDFAEPKPDVKYRRDGGWRPKSEDNPCNGWYWRCNIAGAASGLLAGQRVAVKDVVSIAGIPMTIGSSLLEGFIPDFDATIVTRILDAGGTIVGKTHCEYFCFSGGSHTNATGPVHNPHKMGYSAGGSSSGSGVVVATGEVDMAIGGDQGGSIRMPGSWCGIYGMKGTHGLVPYTGVMPIEITLDHTGPMTANVRDNALLLEVLAGADGLDPRQNAPKVANYTEALDGGVKGLRIGVVREGFGHANSEADVDAKVKAGAELLRKLGATVDEISVPMHALGPAIWLPIAAEGGTEFMMKGNGMGTNWRGLYTTSLLDAHSAWKYRADELSDSLKITMLLGQYFTKHYRGHFYSKAQNLSRKLRAAYDQAFAKYDLLLMPTLPMKATPLPPPDAPRALYLQRAFEMIANTAPFDATGHPAMTLPCGMSEGLPIGLMLIGKHFDESTIYRAAAAFEGAGDWKKM